MERPCYDRAEGVSVGRASICKRPTSSEAHRCEYEPVEPSMVSRKEKRCPPSTWVFEIRYDSIRCAKLYSSLGKLALNGKTARVTCSVERQRVGRLS